MTRQVFPVVLIVVILSIFWSSTGEAQIEPLFGRRTGFVLEGSFAINGITDDDYLEDYSVFATTDTAVGPIVGLGVGAFYRPLPFLSVGGTIYYGFLNVKAVNFDNEAGGFFSLLAEVRGHYPIRRFDPWVGFGLGYALTFATGDYWVNDRRGEASMTLHGVGVSLGVGTHIFVTERIAVTPFFRMIFGGWPTACVRNDSPVYGLDVDECDDVDDIYNDADRVDDWPHLWMVGVAGHYVL